MKLRVASYNIQKAIGVDMRRDPDRILRVIADLNADIVLLQEADQRFNDRRPLFEADQIRGVTGLKAVEIPGTGHSLGWHGNLVLIRPDFAVLAVRPIDLPSLEPRGAVAVRLGLGAARLTALGAHLGLLRRFRRLQLSHLTEAIAQEERRFTVIGGDFNEWRAERGVEPLLKHFTVVQPGPSYHSALPMAALDRFAVGEALTVEASGVFDAPAARVASDHRPIYADIRLTPEA